jgi:hypothetical protein
METSAMGDPQEGKKNPFERREPPTGGETAL